MTDTTPSIERGKEYVVFFRDGAFDGQSERRVATAEGWEDEITVIAGVDGIETMLVYRFASVRALGDQVQVTYVWDQSESDDIEDLDDRNEH